MFIVIEPYRFLPPINGGHKANYHVCEQLSKKTPLTCISTTNNPDIKIPFKIEKVFGDKITKYINPFVGWKIYKSAKRLKTKQILLNQPFMSLLILPICRILGIPFLIFSHNIEYTRFKSMGKVWWPLMKMLESFAYKTADKVLFISEEDRQFAIKNIRLMEDKCLNMPYGTSVNQFPMDIAESRRKVYQSHQLSDDTLSLFYFGPMDYAPNQKGLENLLYQVLPEVRKTNKKVHLFLAGKNIQNKELNYIQQSDDITWLGFVDDLDLYIKGTDVMLNPIWIGGGVKIKLMESLSLGATAISYRSGSFGINIKTLEDKITIIEDEDSKAFAQKIIETPISDKKKTPKAFYDYHHWEKITDRTLTQLSLLQISS
ncbi:glycosyltransferase [Flammeovirga yaeyamensis]|uniref:Glycosyltransferase n=2 Tax=Flammeovirga yaeyamensis TaxID=367791 RepID=A0AAX1N6P3_9BACT|nr:glycosyltransferase family 4 protein [Flammeovirga yaeyamensis]MBB3698070.1 hypothetical protein [Flammeovirga yaeyamensis]NMF34571.1 glycosyltransferase family 4 protein [Flammeovirga yaeyamensis]QWG01548.1 glycosyltransferase [Flammeovirga yaeyamensis]